MKRPKFTGKDSDYWLLKFARRWEYPINLKNYVSVEKKMIEPNNKIINASSVDVSATI